MNEVLKNLKQSENGTFLMFIDGEWTESSDGGSRTLFNPATGEAIGQVAEGTSQDAERAIEAARRAFDEGPWAETTAQDRARLLLKLADEIEANGAELAEMETLSNGKPLREAEFDEHWHGCRNSCDDCVGGGPVQRRYAPLVLIYVQYGRYGARQCISHQPLVASQSWNRMVH